MSHEESGCEVEYPSYRNKPAIKYMQNNLQQVLDNDHGKCIGITCVYDPNEIDIESAWKKVIPDVVELHTRIQNEKDVLFVMSAIEIHGAQHPVAKKPKILTYDSTKEEKTTDEKKKKRRPAGAVDLSNPEFYKEQSDQLRMFRMKRIVLEDQLKLGQIDQLETQKQLKSFDDRHGLLATQRKDNSGRTLMLDAQTFFRIEWASPLDPAHLNRYFIEKEVDEGKDTGVSLVGYPHIHLAICQGNFNGKMTSASKFGPIIGTLFYDVQIGARTGKGRKVNWDNPCNLLGYIMKNARHIPVDERLGDNKQFHVVTNLARCKEPMCKFFHELAKLNNRMWIINDQTQIVEVIDADGQTSKVSQDIKVSEGITTKKGDTNLEQAYSRVKYLMEKNKYKLSNGRIYQKVPNSKMTWKIAGEGTKFSGKPSYFMDRMQNENNIFVIPHREKIIATMTSIEQDLLPSIDLDCQWIEFGDCYLCMALGTVIKDNDKYPCIGYYPEILWDDIVNNTVAIPKKFIEIIDNSIKGKEDQKRLYDELFKLYLPRIHKDPVLYLLGEANSGKTTVIDTITKLLPQDRRMLISDSKFALSTISDKYLLVIDEGQGVSSIPEAMMLKILEGDSEIPVDVKHATPITVDINVNIIMASNNDLYVVDNNDIYEVDVAEQQATAHGIPFTRPAMVRKNEAISKRLLKFTFKTLENHMPGVKTKVIQERGRVILWLARNYYGELTLTADKEETERIYEDWKSENLRYTVPIIDVSLD